MKRNFTLILGMLLLFVNSTQAQSKVFTISGKVTSFEESLALKGVSILVKGTNIYSRTQADGRYSIEVPEGSGVLVFELKDFDTQEVIISGKKQYDVVLKRNVGNALLKNDPGQEHVFAALREERLLTSFVCNSHNYLNKK
ncbi:MAG: TonB-dependent receptor [Ferruginibacter sp.]|nr:TonB-dependent receptor [Ferruginibacter sp.]